MDRECSVSVIMPTYNTGRYIGKAIESVFDQIGDVKIEIIIVDDNSTDETQMIVEEMKRNRENERCSLIYVRNEQKLGVAKSRNKGVNMATGEYVAFLDADDWWTNDKLEVQVAYMEGHAKEIMCCTARELMNADGSTTGRKIDVPDTITYDMLLRTNSIPCSSVLIRTEIAKKYPMHNDELHEDYIMWLEILKDNASVHGINQPMLKSRLSEGGKSRNKINSLKMQYGVYRLIGMSKLKAAFYICCYALNGVKKYYA